jgi:hypothetical protein
MTQVISRSPQAEGGFGGEGDLGYVSGARTSMRLMRR